jgi:putative transposase
MARLARVVVPGVAHLVTQRGNRRETVFFGADDYARYRALLAAAVTRAGAQVWAYCLMPNHVHIVIVPNDADGLRRCFAESHRTYTSAINARQGWTGHLWQGRFGSVPMDEAHLLAAVRYVSLNPVRAGLVAQPEEWPWSSTAAHAAGQDDALVRVAPVLERVETFRAWLAEEEDAAAVGALRRAETIGRPVGSREWVRGVEARVARRLEAGKRGRKGRLAEGDGQQTFCAVSP